MTALDEARARRTPQELTTKGRDLGSWRPAQAFPQPSPEQRVLSAANRGAGPITLPTVLGLTYRYDHTLGREVGLTVTDRAGRDAKGGDRG